jgi:hypothetical protein
MRKKVKKYSGTTDSLVKSIVPAQIRTFVGTLAGDREPITEKDFTDAELAQAKDAVVRSRKEQVASKNDLNNSPIDETVNYHHYEKGAGRQGSDYSVLPSDAMRNTLGRFRYEKTPQGRLVATDNYDFKDDLVKEAGVRPSSAYEKMNTLEKVGALAKDTFGKKGIATLPSRVGSAFIGNTKRPVRLDLGEAPYKKGGVIRGGGIEIKGKTKGRFV